MDNVLQTVLSQYGNSPILLALIEDFNECIDPDSDLDAFYTNVWDIATADTYGLDNWGRILGVSRVLNIGTLEMYFGFTGVNGRLDASGDSFGGGPVTPGAQSFYAGESVTQNYQLTNAAYRTLLLAKALANISDCSIKAINQLLINIFLAPVVGRTGNAYCTDGLDMTMTYTFDISPPLTPPEIAIISQSGVLPKPAGVSVTLVQL